MPTLSTQAREPELDADHSVIVIEDTNWSPSDNLPRTPLRNAANRHSIFSTARARHTQSHQLSAPQLLPYLDFDTARHRPDILTLSRGTNKINNPQFGDIFFLVWILDFSPTADSVATFFLWPLLCCHSTTREPCLDGARPLRRGNCHAVA